MKERILIVAFVFVFMVPCIIKAQWSPVGNRIKTEWASKIDPAHVLPEYPRPIMERKEWKNLNGIWQYSIEPIGGNSPAVYRGNILVPYPVESSLSGVGKNVGKENYLWYKKVFTIPSNWKDKRILLHFGAVDWKTDVWVNNIKVGNHTGGYTPFSFEISTALKKGENKLEVRVWDPTDKGYQPRGKQVDKPGGIMYSPVTGIWQTVWLEPVSDEYIKDLKIIPDIDKGIVSVDPDIEGNSDGSRVEVNVLDGTRVVASSSSINGCPLEVQMPSNRKLWSPDHPFLYSLRIDLYKAGKLVDEVESYTAMRKYSIGRDINGMMRLELNNRPIFEYGPLDQGWWPDGLYTAPTDDALRFDLLKIKEMGFNMVRKHVKVEPARWYTYCDKIGLIVWQDMPSGDTGDGPKWQSHNYFNGTEFKRSEESEADYRKEWKDIIDYLYSYPCIGVWVPFNEAWGQFKTPEIAEWTKKYDSSRLVDPASGGNHYDCGDILDLHNYPGPAMYMYDARRATVVGEYGGIGYPVKGHLWEAEKSWGYIKFNSSNEVTDQYVRYASQLGKLVEKGICAAVYTQITDVGAEVNGLMTYDRKIMKVDEKKVKEANEGVIKLIK